MSIVRARLLGSSLLHGVRKERFELRLVTLWKSGATRLACRAEAHAEGIIKVCGIVSTEDARFASSNGADLIGMILWPKAGRSVSLDLARKIAFEVSENGSEAVGVFVDEDAEAISRICQDVGIRYAQLHGDVARKSFGSLPEHLKVIYVVHANRDGVIETELPLASRQPDWFLVDSLKGGSGEKFDWEAVQPPVGSLNGWLLAGGLNDENVGTAIEIARPNGVDVSSGVCDRTKLNKDRVKVSRYITGARQGFCNAP